MKEVFDLFRGILHEVESRTGPLRRLLGEVGEVHPSEVVRALADADAALQHLGAAHERLDAARRRKGGGSYAPVSMAAPVAVPPQPQAPRRPATEAEKVNSGMWISQTGGAPSGPPPQAPPHEAEKK